MKKLMLTVLISVLVVSGAFVAVNSSSVELQAHIARTGTAYMVYFPWLGWIPGCVWDGGQGCYEVTPPEQGR